MPRLTPHQKDVLARLRAGEHMRFNYANGGYQFSGGGKVANATFRSLLKDGRLREIGTNEWVATEKGGGDAGKV